MRTALVGLGTISFQHLAKLRDISDVEIVGICDLSETLARAVSERFEVGPYFTNYDRMLAETQPDAVHVLTPPQSHGELTLKALAAGVHVLVEKPIAPTWDEYEEMRDVANDQGLLLVEDYTARFSPGVLRAIEVIRAGRVGEVVNVHVFYGGAVLDNDPDLVHYGHRLPGGALQDFATHPVSLVLAFMGESDVEVRTCQRKIDRAALSNDDLRAILGGERATGFLALSGHVQPPAFNVHVEGTRGTLDLDVATRALYLSSSPAASINGLRRGAHELRAAIEIIGSTLSGSKRDPYEGLGILFRQFYEAAAGNGPAPISPGEMDAVNRVLNDLFASERQL